MNNQEERRARRREVFANPFFTVLLATSVVFVLTVLAYLVCPSVLAGDGPNGAPGPNSIALATWLDRNAPSVLAVEFCVMLVTGVLAMMTDPWFSPRSKTKPPA